MTFLMIKKFCENTYLSVRVIGIKDPSIIVSTQITSYIIYRTPTDKRGTHVIAFGENREYVSSINEIRKVIK